MQVQVADGYFTGDWLVTISLFFIFYHSAQTSGSHNSATPTTLALDSSCIFPLPRLKSLLHCQML